MTNQTLQSQVEKKHCALRLTNKKKDIKNYNDEFLSHFIGEIMVEFYKGDYYCI